MPFRLKMMSVPSVPSNAPTPNTLRSEDAVAAFRAHKADAAVVVAYGLILPVPVLEAVPLGCFNLHASLLPRWRGAAPINRAIMAGDAESGVMVMRMAAGLDTGPIAIAERLTVGADITAGDLHDVLALRGADLIKTAEPVWSVAAGKDQVLVSMRRGAASAHPPASGAATGAGPSRMRAGGLTIHFSRVTLMIPFLPSIMRS